MVNGAWTAGVPRVAWTAAVAADTLCRMPRPDAPATHPAVVPVLTDGTVTLRAHRRADVDAIVELCNDPEMLRWTTVPRPYRKADALRFLAQVKEQWLAP